MVKEMVGQQKQKHIDLTADSSPGQNYCLQWSIAFPNAVASSTQVLHEWLWRQASKVRDSEFGGTVLKRRVTYLLRPVNPGIT
jgi:hypothetical protein